MSRSASFLLALAIYAACIGALVFALQRPMQQAFGNSTIELLSEDFDFGGSEINQSGLANTEDLLAQNDAPAEPAESQPAEQSPVSATPVKDASVANESEKAEKTEPNYTQSESVDDLFNTLDVSAPKQIEQQPDEKKKRALEALKNALNSQNLPAKKRAASAGKVAKSTGEKTGSGAQTTGLFDQYFSRINLYLKSKWSLVVRNYPSITEADELIIDFKITPAGLLQIDSPSRQNLPIERAAAQFSALINADARSFGPPPHGEQMRIKARLGLRFSASIK